MRSLIAVEQCVKGMTHRGATQGDTGVGIDKKDPAATVCNRVNGEVSRQVIGCHQAERIPAST